MPDQTQQNQLRESHTPYDLFSLQLIALSLNELRSLNQGILYNNQGSLYTYIHTECFIYQSALYTRMLYIPECFIYQSALYTRMLYIPECFIYQSGNYENILVKNKQVFIQT